MEDKHQTKVRTVLGIRCHKCSDNLYYNPDITDPVKHKGIYTPVRGVNDPLPNITDVVDTKSKPNIDIEYGLTSLESQGLAKCCTCGHTAVIWDADGHINLYCNDVTKCSIYTYIIKSQPSVSGRYDILYQEKLKDFTSCVYVDYYDIRHSEPSVKQKYKKPLYERKTRTKYNENLVSILDRHKDTYANKYTPTLKGIPKD